MKRRLIKLMRNVRGATAIEYGLIVALIVIVVVAGISVLGNSNGGSWGNMTNKVSNALPAS
jgi:pilus assembly protein Flp/PilA